MVFKNILKRFSVFEDYENVSSLAIMGVWSPHKI